MRRNGGRSPPDPRHADPVGAVRPVWRDVDDRVPAVRQHLVRALHLGDLEAAGVPDSPLPSRPLPPV